MSPIASPPSASSPLHVVVGAGQIGPLVAEGLRARGVRVRMLRRGRPDAATLEASQAAGMEIRSVDVTDPAAAAAAMEGAAVVYHCANPRYHLWPSELLPLARGIRGGAARVGARLVVLDNLYMYRLPADGRLAEDTEVAPVSKKGALRARAAEELLAAHAAGELKVTLGRAADFVGPGVTASLFGDRLFPALLAGRTVDVMGDPDQPHSYSYAPDVAAGLVTLGLAGDDAYGRVWHLPVLPAQSTRAWLERFAAAFGRPAPKVRSLSPLVLRLFGLFVPEAAELPEMMYQWRGPFRLDDSRFRAAFGATPTPLAEVVEATAAWARAAFGGKGAPVARAS